MTSKNFQKRILVYICILVCGFMPYNLFAADNPTFEIIKIHPSVMLSIALGDIDHDGYTDIIHGGGFFADISLKLMYGGENLNFESPVTITQGVETIVLDYVNNDTLLDILAFRTDLNLLVNNGNRTFTAYNLGYGPLWSGIATGYFNDDQYLDVLGISGTIFLGDGSGYFPATKPFPYFCQTVYSSDFNNDGIDDVVALDQNGNGKIFLNDGDANFSPAGTFSLGALTLGASINNPFADFNLDGNADFAFVTPVDYSDSSRIVVGYGDGTGDILSMDSLMTTGTAYSLAISDINRDNLLDLIASDATNRILVMYTGQEGGGFADSMVVDMVTDSTIHAMATGDVDRDGNPDFVCGSFYNDSVTLAINLLPDQTELEQTMATTGYSNVTLDITNPAGYRISRNYRTVAASDYRRLDINADAALDEQTLDQNLRYGEYKIVIKSKLNAEPGSLFSSGINIGDEQIALFKDYEIPDIYTKKDGSRASDSIVFYYSVETASSIKPPNGKRAIPRPTFDWTALVASYPYSSYYFQLDNDYDFSSPIIDVTMYSPQFTPETPLTPGMYYWHFRSYDDGWTEFSRTFAVEIVEYLCGDADSGGDVNLLDITFLINFLYKAGPAPELIESADVNSDGTVNLLDITFLICYLYKNGPDPTCL